MTESNHGLVDNEWFIQIVGSTNTSTGQNPINILTNWICCVAYMSYVKSHFIQDSFTDDWKKHRESASGEVDPGSILGRVTPKTVNGWSCRCFADAAPDQRVMEIRPATRRCITLTLLRLLCIIIGRKNIKYSVKQQAFTQALTPVQNAIINTSWMKFLSSSSSPTNTEYLLKQNISQLP